MFNLIISIIAIALVVVLAGASLYYGGDAFNSGNSDAKASTLINQAQQIQAAATLFKSSEGGAPEALTDLTANGSYMTSAPKLPVGDAALTWDLEVVGTGDAADEVVAVEIPLKAKTELGITKEICKTVNADGSGVVFCSAVALDALVAGEGSDDATIDGLAVDAPVTVHMQL